MQSIQPNTLNKQAATPSISAELGLTNGKVTPAKVVDREALRQKLEAEREALRSARVGLPIVSGADLFDRQFPPRKPIVDGLINRGNLVLLASRPKAGKSYLLLQMAQAIDTGAQFLGRFTTKANVLYLALEDGDQRVHERMQMRKWKPQNVSFAFHLLPLSGDGIEQLRNAATPFDVVVIDTLRAACGGETDENDNAEMGAIVQALADYAHTESKTVIISHHTRKGDAEDAFDLIRGAGAIRGAYDVGLLIQRKPKEAEAVLRVESRDVEADDMTIKFDSATGWSYEGDGARLGEIQAGRKVCAALSELGEDQTADDIATHLKVSAQTIRKQLTTAEREGLVIRRTELNPPKGKKPHDLWSLKDA